MFTFKAQKYINIVLPMISIIEVTKKKGGKRKIRHNNKFQKLRLVNGGLLVHNLLVINWLGLLNKTVLILNRFNLFILWSGFFVTLSVGSGVSLK